MSPSQGVIDLQRLGRGSLGLWPRLSRRSDFMAGEDRVALCQRSIGESVTRVLVDRLLKIVDSAF